MTRDIFISYKNDNAGNNFGKRLYDDLTKLGFNVYFNPEGLESGSFSTRLLHAVAECTDFILILSQTCLDQLMRHEDVDWIREEVLAAKAAGKNIVPVLMDGVIMPKRDSNMPEDLRFLPDTQAARLPEQYASRPLDSLLGLLQSKPLGIETLRDVANCNPDYDPHERLVAAREKAKGGDVKAMYELALMYFYGLANDGDAEGGRDFRRAAKWLQKVAASDDVELASDAHTLIARMYYQSIMPREEQSYEKSLEHFEAAGDNAFAIAQLAFMHKVGCGCDLDLAKAEEYYLKATELGDVGSIEGLAAFYESVGRVRDAIATYGGMPYVTPEAHYRLGKIYRDGRHVEPPVPDFQLAENHFRSASLEGHLAATRELGKLYFRPSGPFPKNFEEAQRCFKKAADAGDADAQYMLAYMYGFGYVERNVPEAIRYFEAAAAQGHTLSVCHLGFFYQEPECRNYRLAFEYCKRAADEGSSDCAFLAGSMLLAGRGCQPDVDQAYVYLKKAVDRGFYQAQFLLDQIEEMDEML